jgi:putative membrane protein
MNCYNHIDLPAVATCIDCGKGLCSECSNKYTILICDSCSLKRLYTEKSSIATRWGISIAIAVLFTLLNFEILPKDFLIYLIMLPSMIICVFIISISIQYGWRALNSVMPPVSFVVSFFISWLLIGWFLALIGWILYVSIRVTLSFFIGLIITPIMLFKDIKRYKEVRKIIECAKG